MLSRALKLYENTVKNLSKFIFIFRIMRPTIGPTRHRNSGHFTGLYKLTHFHLISLFCSDQFKIDSLSLYSQMATLHIARDKKKCLLFYESHKARYHIFTSTYTCIMCRFLSDRFESYSKHIRL